jgi:hypothetical protein
MTEEIHETCTQCGETNGRHAEWCDFGSNWSQGNFLWLRECYWRLKERYDALRRKTGLK